MIVQDLIDLVAEQTRDTDNVTWTLSDILIHINNAMHNIIQRAPQANSVIQLVDCVTGSDQTLPNDAISIINVISNDVDASGRQGNIIHEVDVISKDAYSPGWRQSRPSTVVQEWMKRSSPIKYHVWPPLADVRKLRVEYSKEATEVIDATSVIGIANEYIEAVRLFVMYMVYSRDSEDTPSINRAALYKQQFEQFFK